MRTSSGGPLFIEGINHTLAGGASIANYTLCFALAYYPKQTGAERRSNVYESMIE